MTSRRPTDELPPSIVRALESRPRVDVRDHPGDPELAAYLDGALTRSRREAIETHLAGCAGCRELALAAADAATSAEMLARPTERPRAAGWLARRPVWAAAAATVIVLLAAPLVLWLRGAETRRLAALGVERAELAAADPGLAATAHALARGRLGPTPGLEHLLAIGEGSALRSAEISGPQPLLPRWSAVTGVRPRLDLAVPTRVDELEVLIVDHDEKLVGTARLSPPGSETPIVRDLEFPSGLPDLEPGGLYAWRLSGRVGDEWSSSEFAPFRVLEPTELEVLESDLESAGDDPFLRATAYLGAGVDRQGLAALAAAAQGSHEEQVRERLRAIVEAVHRRQHLPPDLAAGEAQRLFGTAAP